MGASKPPCEPKPIGKKTKHVRKATTGRRAGEQKLQLEHEKRFTNDERKCEEKVAHPEHEKR